MMPPANAKTGVESLKHKYQWTVSRLGMNYTDLFYFRAFYNTTNPASLTQDTFIQSGYMTLKEPGDPTTQNTTQPTPGSTESTPVSIITETAQASGNTKLELAIGAGVGIPFGFLAIAALLGIILHHRRRATKLPVLSAQSSAPVNFYPAKALSQDDQKPIMLDTQLPRGYLDGYPVTPSSNARYELGSTKD